MDQRCLRDRWEVDDAHEGCDDCTDDEADEDGDGADKPCRNRMDEQDDENRHDR